MGILSFFLLVLNISFRIIPSERLFNEEYLSNWIQKSPDLIPVDILDVYDFIEAYDADDDPDLTEEFEDSVDDE